MRLSFPSRRRQSIAEVLLLLFEKEVSADALKKWLERRGEMLECFETERKQSKSRAMAAD